jgi:predicted DCC family thiol-disulfide oxidoreductase YuxK
VQPGPNHIILFDGICNLCNGAVQFVIRNDKKKRFKFASLQSETGKSLLLKGNLDPEKTNSFVLISESYYYTRSTAALKVLKLIGGRWSLLYGFILVPGFIRDFVYNLIAKNRYRWFGKKDNCMIPNASLTERFLD